jgi:Protein of unknown function (DUF2752)
MRLIVRRLGSGELNHELLWLTVSVGSLGCAAIWLSLGLPWPTCLFHELTGLPCLTCGATRSTIAFLHGNFATAWSWNPLAFIALCAVALFDLYALSVLIMRAQRLRIVFLSERAKHITRFVVIAVLALNWIYLLNHYQAFAA